MEEHAFEDQIEQIIDFALGRLATWKRPLTLKSVGPAHPQVLDDFERELRDLRAELRATLETEYLPDQLSKAFPQSQASNPLFQIRGKHQELVRKIRYLDERRPQGFIGGWSVGGREIDIAHWRGFPALSINEITLLSVGRDPRKTDCDYLFTQYGRSKEADEMLDFLEDRQEQIARAFGFDPDDSVAKISATEFLHWVNKSSIKIDERFRRMLRENWAPKPGVRIADPVQLAPTDAVPHGSSHKAYARLITAIAIRRYALREEKEIGRVTKLMTDDTDFAGLGVTRTTIRNILRLGWSLLPEEDRPK